MASADSKTNSRRCSCIIEPVERKNSERERQRECLLANGRSVGGVQAHDKKIDAALTWRGLRVGDGRGVQQVAVSHR